MSNRILSTLSLALLILSGCSNSTELVGTYKISNELPKAFEKIGMVVMVPSNATRAAIEQGLAKEFIDYNQPAMATFTIFPLAGRTELITQMELTAEDINEKIKLKTDKFGLNGLIIVSLLDTRTTERYIGGSGYQVMAVHPSSIYPEYGYSLYDYYGYAYSTVYDPGYYETTTAYFMEINLYDVESASLLWTGQTKTTDPDNLEEEAAIFASLIRQELMGKEIIK